MQNGKEPELKDFTKQHLPQINLELTFSKSLDELPKNSSPDVVLLIDLEGDKNPNLGAGMLSILTYRSLHKLQQLIILRDDSLVVCTYFESNHGRQMGLFAHFFYLRFLPTQLEYVKNHR